MRAMALVGVCVLALAACSPGEPEATAPAGETAPTGPLTVDQAAQTGPEAFVRALYARYDPTVAPAAGETAAPAPGRDPIYSRKMNAMIGADVMAAKGEVPTLNYDPICDCQDGTTELQQVTITETGPNKAEAALTFLKSGMPHQQTLFLIKEGPAWRIDDVVVPGRDPLTTTLLAAIG